MSRVECRQDDDDDDAEAGASVSVTSRGGVAGYRSHWVSG